MAPGDICFFYTVGKFGKHYGWAASVLQPLPLEVAKQVSSAFWDSEGFLPYLLEHPVEISASAEELGKSLNPTGRYLTTSQRGSMAISSKEGTRHAIQQHGSVEAWALNFIQQHASTAFPSAEYSELVREELTSATTGVRELTQDLFEIATDGHATDLVVGNEYTRSDLRSLLGLPELKGGAWYTGHVEHEGTHFIFCAIEGQARTGHDYGNRFVGDDLLWKARNGSRLGQPSIQALIDSRADVRIFYREDDRAPFVYAGRAVAAKVRDTSPVEVLWSFADDPDAHPERLAEEVAERSPIFEGARKTVTVNIYERDPGARRKCIAHWGHSCVVCEFDFEERYGELGSGFIHVHHLKPLGEIGEQYALDEIEDLRPVCPNCHAMLHRRKPALSIEELKAILKSDVRD
jgi:5-methylcytosine-specific restriction protein A